MNGATKLALLVGGVFGLAALGSSAKATNGGNVNPGNPSNKVRMWRKLESIPQLSAVHRYALMLIARREGGYNPSAHNGTPSESAASAKAADKNPEIVQRAVACGVDPAALRTGSWSAFQLLAPYFTGTVFEVFGAGGCPFADPTQAPTNLNLQIVVAIEHARDLQGYNGWKEWPTVGNLYLGWGSPARMGADAKEKWKERLDTYRDVARGEKFPAGIVDATMPRFPENPAAIYQALANAGP